MAAFQNITAKELEGKIEAGLDGVLLDVRTPQEVAEGQIPNSISIDINSPAFDAKVMDLDPKKTYYVYCRSGGRSATACMKMSTFGFDKLYNLEGGMLGWTGERTN